jgi:hypothetical protein
MMQLPSGTKLPTTGTEKMLQWAIPVGVIALLFWFWGSISTFVLNTLQNTAWIIFWASALFCFFTFIVPNWPIIVRKINSAFIKMDPLSFMDRYADILSDKLKNLKRTLVTLMGEKENLERIIQDEKVAGEKNMKLAKAAKEQGHDREAASYANDARGNKENVDLYTPNLIRTQKSVEFLKAISENWEYTIKDIRAFNERKRTQYRILKQNAKALKQSEEFLRGDTPERRKYDESIRVAEEQMAQWVAVATDFEERAQPILTGAAIEDQMNQNEGMALLEQYMNTGKLFAPDMSKIEDLDYQMVESKQVTTPKFNLLNKNK